MAMRYDLQGLLERLAPRAHDLLNRAAGYCISRSHYEVSIEHILLQMVEDAQGDLALICEHYEVRQDRLERQLLKVLDSFKTGNPGRPAFSPALVEWLAESWMTASIDFGHERLRTGVMILVMVRRKGTFDAPEYRSLMAQISAGDLSARLMEIVESSKETSRVSSPEPEVASKSSELGEALSRFTYNFTAQAREGRLDPIFGRDREIRQVVDILCRRRKNNPIVVGEAGVGKTALVEGLAARIASGDVPPDLAQVELLTLDLGLLQAGAGVKGEFENRLKSVLQEVKESPRPIILFIDEAHTMIGAGGGGGSTGAADLLKPALARDLRVIGATTWSEYKKYIEKDAALARRFQVVKVEEPTVEGATDMLRGLKASYEADHKVLIRDDAVAAAARLSARYVSGRLLPDKAVDVLDTAAARLRVRLSSTPPSLEDLLGRRASVERELEATARDESNGATVDEERREALNEELVQLSDSEEDIRHRWKQEKELVEEVVAIRSRLNDYGNGGLGLANGGVTNASHTGVLEEGEENRKEETVYDPAMDRERLPIALRELDEIQVGGALVRPEVDPSVIAEVIGDWTGIPIGRMVQDEIQSILKLESHLQSRIKGQDHALKRLSECMHQARAGLQDPSQPLGVFLLVGPSGVGKTETALAIADQLFGGEQFMTTINMSEFQSEHATSRLIGSAPGLVGFGEGGVLTEAVRKRPYSVVLLDEIEKASLKVLNLFYQVFDKGTLTDAEGRDTDFKNTVIFLTSNLGTDTITSLALQSQGSPSVAAIEEAIRPELSEALLPALLGRMTVIPYMPLDRGTIQEIAALKLAKVIRRVGAQHRVRLSYSSDALAAIAERGVDPRFGARVIDMVMRKEIMPALSKAILNGMTLEERPNHLKLIVNDAGEFDVVTHMGTPVSDEERERMADPEADWNLEEFLEEVLIEEDALFEDERMDEGLHLRPSLKSGNGELNDQPNA